MRQPQAAGARQQRDRRQRGHQTGEGEDERDAGHPASGEIGRQADHGGQRDRQPRPGEAFMAQSFEPSGADARMHEVGNPLAETRQMVHDNATPESGIGTAISFVLTIAVAP